MPRNGRTSAVTACGAAQTPRILRSRRRRDQTRQHTRLSRPRKPLPRHRGALDEPSAVAASATGSARSCSTLLLTPTGPGASVQCSRKSRPWTGGQVDLLATGDTRVGIRYRPGILYASVRAVPSRRHAIAPEARAPLGREALRRRSSHSEIAVRCRAKSTATISIFDVSYLNFRLLKPPRTGYRFPAGGRPPPGSAPAKREPDES